MLVPIDFDGAYLRLAVSGCLTEANQRVLHPLIRRARAPIPPVTVSIDLSATGYVDPTAVDLLRWAIDHGETPGGVSRVEVLAPETLPAHRPALGCSPPGNRGEGLTNNGVPTLFNQHASISLCWSLP